MNSSVRDRRGERNTPTCRGRSPVAGLDARVNDPA
jgi:hypothetical protein